MGQSQSSRHQATGPPRETTQKVSSSGDKAQTTAATATASSSADIDSNKAVQEFELKKHRPGCTGMFWRPDPTGKTKLKSNSDWPRDGAMLRGEVVDVRGEQWLLATEVKQAKSSTWKKAPEGAAMPFEYNNHYYLAAKQN